MIHIITNSNTLTNYTLTNSIVFLGANNKPYFSDPTSAQTACKLLGVSMEELSKAMFTSSNKSNARCV